jgi:hypothetical protein
MSDMFDADELVDLHARDSVPSVPSTTKPHIWIEPIRVAGISFYVTDIDEIDGYEVELEREPNNPHHAKAIAIFLLGSTGRKMIGHVPRDLADAVRDDQLPTKGVITYRTPQPKVGLRILA